MINYVDKYGTFQLRNPENINYLYFPLANENGVISCVTPNLGGDSKMGQHHFWMEPVSSENLHNNKVTRNFWINARGHEPWSAMGVSARQQMLLFSENKEETMLEAGIMWHKVIRANKDLGIQSTITTFVPSNGDRVELTEITISNQSSKKTKFSSTAAVPIYGRSADNIRDHRHVTSLLHRIKTVDNGVIVNPTMNFDERGHQKNELQYGFFGQSNDMVNISGFFPTVARYIGNGGSLEHPEAIMTDKILPVSAGYEINGHEALGGIRFAETDLEAGEEKSFYFALAYGEDGITLRNVASKYLSKASFNNALEETKIYWKNRINVRFETGNNIFNQWMYWVTFQPMLRRIYGCSFLPHHDYGKGGRGWRDLWQDCLALIVMNPCGVRDMLLNNFAGVRIDGTNATIIGLKPGEFIADRNNITRVWMDHGFWPFITTKLYIEQTGDVELLLEEKEYFKDPQVHRGEKKDPEWSIEKANMHLTQEGEIYKGSVLEHILLQNLTSFYDVGEHNHIRLRGADWNDALDMAEKRGESVAFTAAYASNLEEIGDMLLLLAKKTGKSKVYLAKEIEVLLSLKPNYYDDINKKKEVLNKFCNLCYSNVSGEKIGIDCYELSADLHSKARWIKEHIRKTEWISSSKGDSWYNGYYDNNGRPLEGESDSGIRMMLTSQVFTIMSGTSTDEQTKEIIKAVDKYLYSEEIGGYRLNTNFHEIKMDMGRMFGFAYGHKENGSVFSHMTIMYAYALYKRGFAKEGFKAVDSLFHHLSDFSKSKVYPGITEYINNEGEGMYHYLTGSASWLLLTALTQMYGIRGSMGNLTFEPKLLLEQFDEEGKASASCVFRNRKLKITYYNENKKEYGKYKISEILINGELVSSNGCEIDKSNLDQLNLDEIHQINVKLI